MPWLALVQVLVQLAAGLVDWLRQRQLIAAGGAEATAASLKDALDAIALAQAARRGLDARLDADPGGLRADDGERRD